MPNLGSPTESVRLRPFIQIIHAPNETVEKLVLARDFPGPRASRESRSGVAGGVRGVLSRPGSVDRPKGVDLADIVDESKQLPLYIHFPFRAQREAMHPLVDTDVGEDRFHDPQSPGINALALFTIDLGLHLVDQVRRLGIHWDGKIPARGGRFAQTPGFHRAGGAVFHTGMVNIIGAIAVGLVAGMTGQFLALRTNIDLLARIEREVSCREETGLGVGSLPAVEALLEASLLGKVRIAFAKLDVGDVGIEPCIFAHNQRIIRMIVAVGGQLLALKIGFLVSEGGDVFFCAFQHRREIFVILAAEGLGGENDLVLGIDQGLGVVTLDHAVRGGPLDRFIVDDIALDLFALAAELGFLLLEELVQEFHLQLEAAFAFLLSLDDHLRLLVRLGMFSDHLL